MTRVLVAPDKFKGSLTGLEVAEALARGLLRTRPDLEVETLQVEVRTAGMARSTPPWLRASSGSTSP